MEDNKNLWQEYESNYIAKYGDNETSKKHIAWLQKSYLDSLIRLSNGKIVEIEKPKMQTNFCFGYGWVDPNGEEEDAADKMAEYAKKSQEYFIKKNLKQVDEIIEGQTSQAIKAICGRRERKIFTASHLWTNTAGCARLMVKAKNLPKKTKQPI